MLRDTFNAVGIFTGVVLVLIAIAFLVAPLLKGSHTDCVASVNGGFECPNS
jgi:hypothetical protein